MLPQRASIFNFGQADLTQVNLSRRPQRMSSRDYSSNLQRAENDKMASRSSSVPISKRVPHWDTKVIEPYHFDSHPNPLGAHPGGENEPAERKCRPSWMTDEKFNSFTRSLEASGITAMAVNPEEVDPDLEAFNPTGTPHSYKTATGSGRRASMREPRQHTPTRGYNPKRHSMMEIPTHGRLGAVDGPPPEFALPQLKSLMGNDKQEHYKLQKENERVPGEISLGPPLKKLREQNSHQDFLNALADVNFSSSRDLGESEHRIQAVAPIGVAKSGIAAARVRAEEALKQTARTRKAQQSYEPRGPSGLILNEPMVFEDDETEGRGSMGASVPTGYQKFRRSSSKMAKKVKEMAISSVRASWLEIANERASDIPKANPMGGLNMEEYPKSQMQPVAIDPKAHIYFSSPNKENPRQYRRAVDSETPMAKVPSSIGLPMGWTKEHDRFIAYLATHAPLDRRGRPEKALGEFHTYGQIAELLRIKFPKFSSSPKIQESAVEKRLDMLELLENNYFSMPYGAYAFEFWGTDI